MDRYRYLTGGEELAKAISSFANWHWNGYGTSAVQRDRKDAISKQLWAEVSELVKQHLGETPQAPRFGILEGDPTGSGSPLSLSDEAVGCKVHE